MSIISIAVLCKIDLLNHDRLNFMFHNLRCLCYAYQSPVTCHLRVYVDVVKFFPIRPQICLVILYVLAMLVSALDQNFRLIKIPILP